MDVEPKLSPFDRKTIRLGWFNFALTAFSLLAAALAAYFVMQQFEEMDMQTYLLSRGADQARKDSVANAIATAKQLDALQGQLIQARRAANQAEISAGISRKGLELSERPWVSAQFAIIGPLVFDQTGAQVTISMVTHNSGHSPAVRGFDDTFEMYPSLWGNPMDPLAERDRICRNAEVASRSSSAILAKTWFPDTDSIGGYAPTMNWDQMRKAQESFPGVSSPYSAPISIIVQVCIAYKASFTNEVHHTGYILSLERTDRTPIFPVTGTRIPANQLRIFSLFITGTEAD